ncbi:tektin-4 [Clarias gariepinus]|uniref:tektin-4 n=1 Tax=Clarias gariepinus TaxID=13013 RepID=UPI00234C9450|nr:tektin-4 [Clarias gariepinus]
MSAEVLSARPRYDPGEEEEDEAPGQQPRYSGASVGLATAGYRSAKYTPAEWFANNRAALSRAAADSASAAQVQRVSKALRAETQDTAALRQTAVTGHLGARLHDIHSRSSELEQHIARLLADTERLATLKRRLERALHATEVPFAIATDNLTCRERRSGPDRVQDRVEEELLKEVELIKSIQALLKKTLDQAVTQIRLNRNAQQVLELDWSDKHEAYCLDDECGRYRNTSTNTQHHEHTSTSATAQHQVCDVDEWIRFTQSNVAQAEREEEASVALCVLCEHVLQETAVDLQAQSQAVSQAFIQRCQELTHARSQLELQLKQVLEQIGSQERNISALQQAVFDKEAPMRVAQSRLHSRALRPNMELCRDQPQLSLLVEVEQISADVCALQQQLHEARDSLARLEESRTLLEKDIGCKTHSLLIDQEKCMRNRMLYPTVVTLSGY